MKTDIRLRNDAARVISSGRVDHLLRLGLCWPPALFRPSLPLEYVDHVVVG